MTEIVTRQFALENNLKTYFNGVPCPKEHIAPRKTISSECTECNREYMKKYLKEYHQKNKDKLQEGNKIRKRLYRAGKATTNRGPREDIKIRARRDLDRRNNARRVPGNLYGLMCVYNQRYHYAMPKWANVDKMKAIYIEAKRLRESTGEDWQVDHIIPARGKSVCGLHVETNLRIIRGFDNMSKKNKLLDEFAFL